MSLFMENATSGLIYRMYSDEGVHAQAAAVEWQSAQSERMDVCAGQWLQVAWIFAARCFVVKSEWLGSWAATISPHNVVFSVSRHASTQSVLRFLVS